LGSERLLDRLGMLARPPSSPESPRGEQKLALRLPASAPENLKQCQEGCCWRWLVHTMLEEVGGLRQGLDEAQEELLGRSGARRKLEQVAEHRALLQSECGSLRGVVEALETELPCLREEREELLREAQALAQRRAALRERSRRLPEELRRGEEQERALEEEVREAEREAEEAREKEEALLSKVCDIRKETAGIGANLQILSGERDQMKEEVQKHDAQQEVKRKSKRRSSPRKAK